jgi:agmatinase
MYTILKIPFDKCIVEKERRGAALGPNAIEKELKDFFQFENISKHVKFIEVKEKDDFEKLHGEIESLVISDNPVVSLGGDHSTSYGVMKAFSKLHKNSCLLFFDAHFDAQDDFLPPTHEAVLKAAVKEGFFKPEDIFVVGVRNYTKEELAFIQQNKIKFQLTSDFSPKQIIEFAKKYDNIYLNLDIDVIDPAFAPGTGWPEPLGLNSKDVLDIILLLKGKIKLLDIVEVSPPKDINNITSRLVARFLAEFLVNRAGKAFVW